MSESCSPNSVNDRTGGVNAGGMLMAWELQKVSRCSSNLDSVLHLLTALFETWWKLGVPLATRGPYPHNFWKFCILICNINSWAFPDITWGWTNLKPPTEFVQHTSVSGYIGPIKRWKPGAYTSTPRSNSTWWGKENGGGSHCCLRLHFLAY